MEVTEDLLTTFNISLVVRGTVSETDGADTDDAPRYALPREKGVFRCAIDSDTPLNKCAGTLLSPALCTAPARCSCLT